MPKEQECECTDSIPNIGLDQESAQYLNAKGSQRELYYGQYLPLRERKLLDKLIKTRAAYDDVRNQILPGNEIKARKTETHHREMDDGDKKHTHSGVRTIVDLVDRGKIGQDPRNSDRPYLKPKDQLIECQSCCSCSSKMQPHRNADIINNHQDKPVNKIQVSSSTHLYAKRKQGDRSKKMRAVHFKTKYIRSDPCTCTTNLSEIANKRHSRLKSKKITKDDESFPSSIESKAIKAKRCVCECNIIKKPNKSLQGLKNAREKVKKSIRSSISKIENSFRIKKDSIMIFRDKLKKKRAMKKYECEPYYCIPEYSPPKCYEKMKMRLDNIKSDIKRSYHDLRSIGSGLSFKTRPKKQNFECDPYDCMPEYTPPKYYEKIKMRLDDIKSNIKRSYHDLRSIGSGLSFKTRPKKENFECDPYDCMPEYTPPKCYEKIKMRLDDIKSNIKKSYHDLRSMGSGISFKTRPKKEKSKSKRKSKSKPVTCACESDTESTEPIVSNFENNDNINIKSFSSKKRKDSSSVKKNGLNVHIEPTVSPKKKTTKSKGLDLGVCKCDKDVKLRKTSVFSKISFTKTKPTFEHGRYTLPHLDRALPRECEASICIPDECVFRKRALQEQSQNTSEYSSSNISHKSVGSIIARMLKHSQSLDKHHAKSENIEPTRQVVRIGSNFSFNIEFYKEQTNRGDIPVTRNKIRTLRPRDEKSVSNKTKYSCPKKVRVQNKSIQSKIQRLSSVKTNYALKRCFCTLQLKDSPKSRKSSHYLKSKEIETSMIGECNCKLERNKSTQTKKHKRLNNLLTPSLGPSGETFMCDSYFDSDKKCDSSSCEKQVLDRFKQNRNKQTEIEKKPRKYSKGTKCLHPMAKTCTKSQCSNFSESSLKTTKQRNDFKDTKVKSHKEHTSNIKNTTNKNIVRISSSFSFNVQFYKENEPIADFMKKDEKLDRIDNKSKQKIREIRTNKRKFSNKSTQSRLKLKDRCHSKASQSSFQTQENDTCCHAKNFIKEPTKKQSKNVCKYMSNTTSQTPEPVANVSSSLLPPFSTPGKCDDFTCKQNIKQRCHENGYKNKKINTVDSLKTQTKSIKTLSDTGSSKRQKSYQTKTPKSLSSKSFAPHGKEIIPHRQAVRIGSNFSFDVKFYKDTSSEKQIKKTVAMADSRIKNRNNKFRNNCKECTCDTIDSPSLHQRETIQINKSNNETKESGIKPFLDKCFCTLKLLKGRKDTIRYISSSKVQSKINTKDLKCRNIQCAIKKSTNQLMHKSKQMSTASIAYKSTSSGTSKSYIKNHKLRAQKTNKPESMSERRISKNTDSSANISINEKPKPGKQVARIGSSFSFNIEFYKEKGDAPNVHEIQSIQRRKSTRISHKNHEDRSIPPYSRKHKYCKKASTHLINDNEKIHDMKRCSERCIVKRDRIERRVTNRPETKNKSVITQESKKSYIKNLLGTCKCDKEIEPRQKSCKHVARDVSYAATGPEKMKSEIIGTDSKLIKCRTQKTQSSFHKPCLKYREMNQPKLRMKSPTKQLVRINSNFSFNTACNRQHCKRKPNPNVNNYMNKSETKRNHLQSMTVSKNGKSSNLGLRLKHCLCSLKYPKHMKNGKNKNENEKETQLNVPIPHKCQRYMCERYVTANTNQPKAKSVSDVKGPCMKTKKVQSSFREHEPSTKKYSVHNIKPEKPRLKHRLQKNSSKKSVRMGSAFKFDIEFSKNYESPDYKDTNIKKLKKEPKVEINTKKINDKRLYGSYFHKHREYQVGYFKEVVTAMQGSAFQQQYTIGHMRVSVDNLKKTIQTVNPVLVQSNENPFRRKYTKSNLRDKGKKMKWRKKHVRFAVSNIETKVKNKHSFLPFNKYKGFRSEIYKTSSEVLKPKRTRLRIQKKSIASVSKNLKKNSPLRAFSSFNKMPKESLSIQSKEKTSKLIEIIPSKKKMTRRKIFKNLQSKHLKRHTKIKTAQTMIHSLDKYASCKCNINRIKKKVKGLAKQTDTVSHRSILSSNKKIQFGSRKSNGTNVSKRNVTSKYQYKAQPDQGNNKKRRKTKPKPQRLQQVLQMKYVQKKNSLFNTNTNKHIEVPLSKEQVLNESKKQSSKSNGYIFANTGFDPINNRSYMNADTLQCVNENCKTDIIDIMPYRKRNFRKTRSRICLSKECKLLMKTTANKYNKANKPKITYTTFKSKFDHKNVTLYKLSQGFHTKTSVCNIICLKQAETNLLENTSKTINTKAKRRSKIIRSIMTFTVLPNSRRYKGNNFSHIGVNNPVNYIKADTVKCPNENCKSDIIQTIMPYRKRNFRKTRSRTCLSKECKLLLKNSEKEKKVTHPTFKSMIDHKKITPHKLSQRFHSNTSVCNDICLKRAKTNLLENTLRQRVKKSSHVKLFVKNNRRVKNQHKSANKDVSVNMSDLIMKKPCCVCSRRYSDTNTEKFQPKAQTSSYVSKNNTKLTVDNKLTQRPRKNNISSVQNFKNKILNFLKTNIKENSVKNTTSCECGNKDYKDKTILDLTPSTKRKVTNIKHTASCDCRRNKMYKSKSELGSPTTPSTKSKIICLCHHKCECSAKLKKRKDKKSKEKFTKQNKQKMQQRKKQTSNRKSKRSNKETSKLIKMYNKTSDSVLLAESCLDVTKMSAGFMWNLIKFPVQVISNPRESCKNFKMGMRDPAHKAISIQQKIGAMRITKNAKVMLESFIVTKFLIHAFDDDPNKRLKELKSRQRVKKRERTDFGCSPYMASLRKRPFLWVYDKCPAFYPQLISLLTGWRQFIDMILFLLAIVVWSPCIFSIELCRAIVCCCLCTG